jgi:hypothetical protein
MGKHPLLVNVLRYQRMAKFQDGHDGIGSLFNLRTPNKNNTLHPVVNPVFDAFTCLSTSGTGSSKKTYGKAVTRNYARFEKETGMTALNTIQCMLDRAFNDYLNQMSVAINNKDDSILGPLNNEIVDSYNKLNSFASSAISKDGVDIYRELLKRSDGWRVESEDKVIYFKNSQANNIIFFTDIYWGKALDLSIKNEISNIGFTLDMSNISWIDTSKIISMGKLDFFELCDQVGDFVNQASNTETYTSTAVGF